MQEPSLIDKRFVVSLAATEFSVAPGENLSIPILVHNQDTEDAAFILSCRGVPSTWVSVPSPQFHLLAGEQREVLLTIQTPAYPDGHAGRHALVVRVASQRAPGEVVEKTCILTVAAQEVPGRIGVLLAATEFSAMPGDTTTIPLVVLNQGLDADTFALSVEDIPSAWVYTPAAAVSLSPGQQREVTLTAQPPASAQTRAGRHPFRIRVSSRGVPGQAAEVACVLTVATLTRFDAELRPERVEAGQPGRVVVENQGNVQQAFTVNWQSTGSEVVFEPEEAQQVRVPPGEVGLVEFVPRPRSRPFLGGEASLPFTARVQAPGGEVRNLVGEVVTRGLLPNWVLPAIGIALLILIAALVLPAILGGGDSGVAPTEAPATEAPPVVETEVPPTEVPTEAPTESPAATEVPPTEEAPAPPTDEPVPTQGPPDGGEGEGPSLPCFPAAFGLMLMPLWVRHRRRR